MKQRKATFLVAIFTLVIFSAFVVTAVWANGRSLGVMGHSYPLSDDTRRVAISTYWAEANDAWVAVQLHPLWGPPTGLLSTTFYDDATDGQALVAEAAGDRTYIDPDDYEAADLGDGQISLYRCELDGTYNAITTSVWTVDVFYWIEDSDWSGS